VKIDARRVDAFLRAPGDVKAVLLHGDDEGLIREREAMLRAALLGGADDPFGICELDGGDVDRLAEEVTALSMSGGRRVVRMRGATDSAAVAVVAAMSRPFGALLILESVDLPSRSRLREQLERAADAAVIGCYHDTGPTLASFIRRVLDAASVSVADDAAAWLAENLGADRAVTRQELTKLAIFVGPGGHVDLDAAVVCCGGATALTIEDAWVAATIGDGASADRILAAGLEQGGTPVGVLRIGLLHLQRLHRARLGVEAGQSVGQAVNALRPPVFFRRMEAVSRAVAAWTPARLRAALAGLAEAERSCKQTGAPAELIVQRLMLAVAQHATSGSTR